MMRFFALVAILLCIIPAVSYADADGSDPKESAVASDLPVEAIPDLSEDNTKSKFLKKIPKNLLLVPIPMSSPTFGTGLILGGAYFYPQTEEQENAQTPKRRSRKTRNPHRLQALPEGTQATKAGLPASCNRTTGRRTHGDSPAWLLTLTSNLT